MSANIPFEIQAEIIKRVLPVKSLIRFRSVSKQWKSLIDSPEFITRHTVNQTHQHHLLVSYEEAYEYKYVSIVDDDSFPQHKFSLVVSPTVKLVTFTYMLDCSHGLVCLYGQSAVLGKSLIVVWNPSIRKSVGIVCAGGYRALGFGVCPKTLEPKIVKITLTDYTDWNWKAEVFTVSSRVWRTISMNIHMPQIYIRFSYNQVLIDGIIYWVSRDYGPRFIVSFDLTSEKFGKIDLPDSLAHNYLSISKLNESLVVLDCDEFKLELDVWKMIKNGDSTTSFAKLYTLRCWANDGCEMYDIIGFTKNGQALREHACESDDSITTTLEAYEPSTRQSSDLGIRVASETIFKITSYTESLLLINHSDSIIQG